mmetsp:Transcript_41266/g.39739  ORF Transcript_41266/g.39739 Transcript_41266/m.39739 type:complete len:121 (-) Transcript_41266:415-777(-)
MQQNKGSAKRKAVRMINTIHDYGIPRNIEAERPMNFIRKKVDISEMYSCRYAKKRDVYQRLDMGRNFRSSGIKSASKIRRNTQSNFGLASDLQPNERAFYSHYSKKSLRAYEPMHVRILS